jgi:hypothetical protein
MNKIIKWLVNRIESHPIYRSKLDEQHLKTLRAVQLRCWGLAMDVRCGKGFFKEVTLDKRLLMCSGIEHSIAEIQRMIKQINEPL